MKSVDNRPWEVALFALCAQFNSSFKDPVLGPTGISALISAMERVMEVESLFPLQWESIVLMLRSLSFLSGHDWVVQSDAMGEQGIKCLVEVLRYVVPFLSSPTSFSPFIDARFHGSGSQFTTGPLILSATSSPVALN